MELTPLDAQQAICKFVDIPSTYKKFEDPYLNARIAEFRDKNKFGITVQKFKENLHPEIEKQLKIWESAHDDEIRDIDVEYIVNIAKIEADRKCLSVGNMVRELFSRGTFPFPIKFNQPWTATIGEKSTTFVFVENEKLKIIKEQTEKMFAENERRINDPLYQIDWLYEYKEEMEGLGFIKEDAIPKEFDYEHMLPYHINFEDTSMVIEK